MFRTVFLVAILLFISYGGPGAFSEVVPIKGDWWHQAAKQTRHTTFVASFDRENSLDADAARGSVLSGGFGVASIAAGLHDRAVRIKETGGHLHFLGGNNFNPHRGTLRMAVRGDVWSDSSPRWLFEARSRSFLGIRRDTQHLSLVIREGNFARKLVSQLELPVQDVSTDQWHTVVASWDWWKGQGLIALDGKALRGPMKFPVQHSPVLVSYLGGGFGARKGGLNLPGMEIDDVVIYDLPVDLLEKKPQKLSREEEALLGRSEQSLRKCFDQIVGLQRWGGWQTIYTWPTLLGSQAQGREWVDFPEYVGNDKSSATPRIAARLLFAYEILGDYAYFEAALKTGEFLLAAQDPDLGFWIHGYEMTVSGIRPAASSRHIKLQDSVQSHPIFFLSYLHRLTGDPRYLSALKKAGEFYLKAQNPNGSWSHHFDAESGMGRTAGGLPQGGEINDLATNDAIDVMAMLYHVTGERKYVDAMKRAGQWLIHAQLRGKTVGWAEQYDREDRPAEARHFEPAAFSTSATWNASRALVELYRFSGDERFLLPVRDALKWMNSKAEDGKLWSYYDVKTARPIACWERKLYFVDDPAQLAWVRKQPIGSWQVRPYFHPSRIKRLLDRAARPRPEDLVPEVTRGLARERLKGLGTQAENARKTQHESGFWIVPKVANFMGSIGAGFSTFSPRAIYLLRYIEAARIAKGELVPGPRTNGTLLRLAYPRADWYEVKWTQ